MGRKSSIDRLPAEVRELIARLRGNGHTIEEILAKLQELDVDVSRSALGRHTKQLDAITKQIRASRGIAEAIVERFGDAPESRTARLNVELLHSNLTRLLIAEEGETVQLEPQEAMFLATALQRLSSASKADTEREIKLRERVAKETREAAAKSADEVAKKAGISDEARRQIEREILGLER